MRKGRVCYAFYKEKQEDHPNVCAGLYGYGCMFSDYRIPE